MNYFKTTGAETDAVNAWIQRTKAASDTGKGPTYNVGSQNCATFCRAGLFQGSATPNGNYSNVPNIFFNELTALATENYSNGQRSPQEQISHTITPCGGDGQKPCVQ